MLHRILSIPPSTIPPVPPPPLLPLQYALRHEGPLRDCGKRWVLNQIVNHTERALLIDSLLSSGFSMRDILVRRLNLTQVRPSPRGRPVSGTRQTVRRQSCFLPELFMHAWHFKHCSRKVHTSTGIVVCSSPDFSSPSPPRHLPLQDTQALREGG